MKHMRHWLLLIAVLSCSLVAKAHDFEVDGIYYNITSSTNFTVSVSYRGDNYSSYSKEYSGEVVIPETVTYNGMTYRVTSISSYAFYGCSSLSQISIGKNVSSIGSYAFYGCKALSSVVIPEGVKNIYSYTFYNCSGLTSVVIPPSVTSIGSYAFYGCSSLTSFSVPKSVSSIGTYAFYNCSKLKTLVLEDGGGTLSLGFNGSTNSSMPFYSCPLDSVYLGRNLSYSSTSVSERPFREKTSLRTVVIGDSVTTIDSYAFYGCNRLNHISMGVGVASIGKYAFNNCREVL